MLLLTYKTIFASQKSKSGLLLLPAAEGEVVSFQKTEAQMPPHMHVGSLAMSGRTAAHPRAHTPPSLHYVNVWDRGGRGRRRQVCENVREAANLFFFYQIQLIIMTQKSALVLQPTLFSLRLLLFFGTRSHCMT